MNYPTRMVVGTAGRYGEGHAWITFQKDGKTFLLEPLSWPLGLIMPRLSTLRYHPAFSMSWDGKTISYYSHKDLKVSPSLGVVVPLVAEWMFLWASFWSRFVITLVRGIGLILFRIKPSEPSKS